MDGIPGSFEVGQQRRATLRGWAFWASMMSRESLGTCEAAREGEAKWNTQVGLLVVFGTGEKTDPFSLAAGGWILGRDIDWPVGDLGTHSIALAQTQSRTRG